MGALLSSPQFTLTLFVNGLVLGSLFGLLAVGVVAVFRTTRTINLAQGALATLGALIYLLLVLRGVPSLVALVITTAVGAAVGALVGQVVGWPLRRAPETSRLVASLGVMMVVLSLVGIAFGGTPRVVPPFVTDRLFSAGSFTVPVDKLIVMALALGAVAAIAQGVGRTRLGLRMRAVAIDAETAALQGVNVHRVVLASWTLGVAVAFGGGVLLTTALTEVSPIALTVVLLQALGATLLGRLQSIPLAMIGGLLLGELVVFSGYLFVGVAGISDIAVFAFVLVILTVQGRRPGLTGERA